jgi:hypothetical protein
MEMPRPSWNLGTGQSHMAGGHNVTFSTVSPAMERKAHQLAVLLTTCSRGRSKQTGQAFYVVPSSNRLSAHWTAIDGTGCTCQRRGTCTHSIAAADVHKRQQPPTAPTTLIRTYEQLYPACAGGCGDVVERQGARCYSCASDEAYRLKQAARRAV